MLRIDNTGVEKSPDAEIVLALLFFVYGLMLVSLHNMAGHDVNQATL